MPLRGQGLTSGARSESGHDGGLSSLGSFPASRPTGETVADGSSPPSSESSFAGWIGATIEGRYRLRELLGEGGMGAVFIATHLRLDKDVAVKIVLPEVAGNRPTLNERWHDPEHFAALARECKRLLKVIW